MIYLDPAPEWAQFRRLYEEIFHEFEMDSVQLADVRPIEPLQGSPPPGFKSSHWLRQVFPHPRLTPIEMSPDGRLSVLDIGCGTGSGLIPFYWSGWSVTGIDINSLALEICTKIMPNGRFIHEDFMDWNGTAATFDAVRIDNCLEHIPNPKAALEKIAYLLKPEGRVYIFVPSGSSYLFKVLGRYHVSSWIPFHLNLFTPPAVRRLCREVGLNIECLRTFQPHSWIQISLRQLVMRPGFYTQFSGGNSGLPGKAWRALGAVLSLLGGGDELVIWVGKKVPSG